MNRLTSKGKIRTVKIGERGQLVIPEDIRRDLRISGNTTLVLIEQEGEIVIKKESAVLQQMEGEDHFWKLLSQHALERAWSREDDIWDRLYKKEKT